MSEKSSNYQRKKPENDQKTGFSGTLHFVGVNKNTGSGGIISFKLANSNLQYINAISNSNTMKDFHIVQKYNDKFAIPKVYSIAKFHYVAKLL